MMAYFITGGASGIGFACAKKLVSENKAVVIFDVDAAQGGKIQVEHDPQQLHFIQGDVSKPTQLEQAFKQTVDHFGRLDGLVVNAGIYCHKALLDLTEAEWDNLAAINLKGAVFTIQKALPYFIKQQQGSIVIISSDQYFKAKPKGCAYAATKGALVQLGKGVALDYADQGVRVNMVCPGAIKTPMTEKVIDQIANETQQPSANIWQAIAKEYPLGRVGKPEEVAELVTFLLSEKVAFITGGVYPIEGGLTL